MNVHDSSMGSDPMDEFDTRMEENANFYPLFTHNYALFTRHLVHGV